ncbi:FAD-dependent oxidoreductase [Escherichia coli]
MQSILRCWRRHHRNVLPPCNAVSMSIRTPHCVAGKQSGRALHQTDQRALYHARRSACPVSRRHSFAWRETAPLKPFAINGIRFDNCGKMLVATSPLEMERMRALWERTAANGIEREWLNADELREREPNITGLGGIFVPSSGIVSYREVTAAMAKIFQDRGGEIIYNASLRP